jgi:hypothetical protein
MTNRCDDRPCIARLSIEKQALFSSPGIRRLSGPGMMV